MSGRCYLGDSRSGPCCREGTRNVYYKVECGLMDENTRNNFKEYLLSRGKREKKDLIDIYECLSNVDAGLCALQAMPNIPLNNARLLGDLEGIDLEQATEKDKIQLHQELISAIATDLRNDYQAFLQPKECCRE